MLTVEYKNDLYNFVDAFYKRRMFSNDENYYLFVQLEKTPHNKMLTNSMIEVHFINWDIHVNIRGNGVDMSYWVKYEDSYLVDFYDMLQTVKRLLIENMDNDELT